MWVAVFTAYSNGERVDTPVCTGLDPQMTIDYAKAGLMGLEQDAWDETFDSGLGRNILYRKVRRSHPKEIFEYGWVYATSLPDASEGPVDITVKDVASDQKAGRR